ncbi:hypothetical protein [Sphaerisporangium fuscum]|uniref:hypothetical protein n=1 Tax=Sphaerisporangium fuscum TaxID=2835868 RepID=UPI001BDC895E|nr:hypothetical protein [Sphaerisporangium fuscum]
MGRGRHTSSRGRESDPEWAGEHDDTGWDDERGTQEWLSTEDPDWLQAPDGGKTPSGGFEAPQPPRHSAWDSPGPAWPSAWDDEPSATPRPAPGADTSSAFSAPSPTGPSPTGPSPTGPLPTGPANAWDTGDTGTGAQESRPAWDPAPTAEQPLSAWEPASTAQGPTSAWEAAPTGQGDTWDPASTAQGGTWDPASTAQGGTWGPAPTAQHPSHGWETGPSASGGWDAPAAEPPGTWSAGETAVRSGRTEPGAAVGGLAGPGRYAEPGEETAYAPAIGPGAAPEDLRPEEPHAEGGHVPPKRRRGQRQSRERKEGFWRGRRLVALSAVAVVAAIGTAVVGVKLASSGLDLTSTTACPKGQACAAVAQGKPSGGAAPSATEDSADPVTSDPSESETTSPRASKPARPTATAVHTPERRNPQPSARPTPERTRITSPTPKASRTKEDTPDPTPTEEPTDTATPDATPTDDTDPVIGPGRVAVDFAVSGLSDAGYTGQVTISNNGPVLSSGWSVRIPVGGSVTGADGATWTQEGGTLVLSSTQVLGENEQAVVTFAADGDSSAPDRCELNGGSCRIRVNDNAVSQVEPNP